MTIDQLKRAKKIESQLFSLNNLSKDLEESEEIVIAGLVNGAPIGEYGLKVPVDSMLCRMIQEWVEDNKSQLLLEFRKL